MFFLLICIHEGYEPWHKRDSFPIQPIDGTQMMTVMEVISTFIS